jgi:hypothetical protein
VNREERREWRRHVFGHADLTHGQRLVLLALEGFADYPAGTNARPGVVALAEMCGFGERVVKSALKRGRRLKLIEQTARANPKLGLAAVYRLLPAPVSRCTSVHVETDFKVHETTFQGAPPCPPPIHTNPVTPRSGGHLSRARHLASRNRSKISSPKNSATATANTPSATAQLFQTKQLAIARRGNPTGHTDAPNTPTSSTTATCRPAAPAWRCGSPPKISQPPNEPPKPNSDEPPSTTARAATKTDSSTSTTKAQSSRTATTKRR